MSASLQPINPYQEPNAPAFSKDSPELSADPLLILVLRDWREQSRAIGWTFLLIAAACGLTSWVMFANEYAAWWFLSLAVLVFIFSAVSLWAGILACFRQRSGAWWCCRLATAVTGFCAGMVVIGIIGSVLFQFDLAGWIAGGMLAGAISMPITSQAWRLTEFVRQLDRAGIPLDAPVPSSDYWT